MSQDSRNANEAFPSKTKFKTLKRLAIMTFNLPHTIHTCSAARSDVLSIHDASLRCSTMELYRKAAKTAPATPNPAIGWRRPAPFGPPEELELALELADSVLLPLLLVGTPCPVVVEALGVEDEKVALPREEAVRVLIPVAPVPIGVAMALPVPAGTEIADPWEVTGLG